MTSSVGQRIGNYHLLRLLGQGDFADVYQGEHVSLQSSAALNTIASFVVHTKQDGSASQRRR